MKVGGQVTWARAGAAGESTYAEQGLPPGSPIPLALLACLEAAVEIEIVRARVFSIVASRRSAADLQSAERCADIQRSPGQRSPTAS